MKRYMLLMIIAIVMLTGCKKERKVKEPISLEDRTRMQFYWYGTDDISRMMLDLCEEFNYFQDKLYVTGTFSSNLEWQEFVERSIEDEDKMDLLQINPEWFGKMTKEDTESFLVDFNTFSSDLISLDSFSKEMLEYCMIDGKLVALPISYSVPLFYWNEAVFKKVKLKTPTNLEELLESGEALVEAIGENYYPLVMDEESRFLFLLTYLEQTYGKKWMENGEISFSVEELQAGLEILRELEDRHVIPKLEEFEGLSSVAESDNWMYAKYGGVYIWSMDESKYKKMISRSDEFRAGTEFDDMGKHKLKYYKIEKVVSILQKSEYINECATYLDFFFNSKEAAKHIATQHKLLASEKSMEFATKKKVYSKEITNLHKNLKEQEMHIFMDRNSQRKIEDFDQYLEVIKGLSSGKYNTKEAAEKMKEER